MGKIVKYCSSCDEGFAEKFGFCPNCGKGLEAFELNPVAAMAPPVEEISTAPLEIETVERFDHPAEIFDEVNSDREPIAVEEPAVEEPVIEEPVAAEPASAAFSKPTYIPSKPVDIDRKPVSTDRVRRPASFEAEHDRVLSEGGFYVTVIEEKNGKQRNTLLLGTLGFMVLFMMGATVYSLFAKDLGIGAIGGDDLFLASLVDAPMPIDEEKIKKDKDDGGGGGGGGREEKQEVNRGDLADQSPDPIRAPDVKIPKLNDPAIALPPATTQGNQKFQKEFGVYGDPNGRFDNLSNGPGSGGGIGSGRGTGQGNGEGTGAGNGIGSGFGNGNGNGNGDGTGDGSGNTPPPIKKPAGVTQNLVILSKPRPGYTDSARQANIQGTVILRVTFLANGQIGGISPVKGLPNGLTEQAIAAARRISFEPKKVDGVGQSLTRQIEYTFSIY
jgi:TonB family protein